VSIAAQYLRSSEARLRPFDPRVRRAAEQLRSTAGRKPIAELANEVSLSERQLERLFREHVGTRPKLFARVARMQAALQTLSMSPARAACAAAASAAGFSDQPHWVREFRALTGLTPRELLNERRVGFVQDNLARTE
jgi:transcriptional regulator GlxA family with amidase domain